MKGSFFIWLLLLTSHLIWGVNIEYTNLTSEFIPTEKSSKKKNHYKLTSKFHVERYIKNTKLLLLRRREYMLKNNYYLDGKFQSSNTELNYKKAYVLGGKVYLFGVAGYINHQKVLAKELIYDGYKRYVLKKCEVRTKFKVYRRSRFVMIVN